MDRYEIDAAGRKDYTVCWRLYNTGLVQSFNPLMVIKAKKGVKRISARVKATYKLRTGLFDLKPDIRSAPGLLPVIRGCFLITQNGTEGNPLNVDIWPERGYS